MTLKTINTSSTQERVALFLFTDLQRHLAPGGPTVGQTVMSADDLEQPFITCDMCAA